MNNFPQMPAHGQSKEQVIAQMQAARVHDLKWQEGRVFSLVFSAGNEAADLLKEAYTLFMSENALNPTAFPSLRRFETDVISMSAALLGSQGNVVGNMTSGGTESILMAVKTARDYARARQPQRQPPEMILPISAHPAFDKAASYFDVRPVRIPVGPDLCADLPAMRAAISPRTILLVGSAPSYPYGVVDPITDIAALALEHDLLCHVDACVGGFMLPFVRQLGYDVPDFDFRVPGVTSLSADLHKYGYAAKGASLILYHHRDLRRYQLHAYTDWPGGIYASPTMAGTRPGGAIAAAWAILNYLGQDGYLRIAREVMQTATILRQGINAIPGIHVMGSPPMSLMAIGADKVDIYQVGDEMTARGWHLDRQQFPPTLHLTVNHLHAGWEEAFLADLAAAAAMARKPSLQKWSNRLALAAAQAATKLLPTALVSRLTGKAAGMVGGGDAGIPTRSAAMYGMMGSLPNRGDLKEVVLDLVEQFTKVQD